MGLGKLGTIRKWRPKGRGPKWIRLEGRIKYRLSDVQALGDSADNPRFVETLPRQSRIEISAAELGQHIASENEKLEDTVT